jgi:peroxiredoxin
MGGFRKLLITVFLISIILVNGFSCGSSDKNIIGKAAPNFTTVSIDDTSINLNNFVGRPVILNFWAIRCPYCVEEMPYLQQVYEEHKIDGLVVLGVNDAESIGNVKPFIENHKYNYTIILDEDGSIGNKFGVYYLLTTYLIDKDGIIRDIIVGSFQNKADIEKHLKKIID